MTRATFEPFTDRQKRTITEAFARTDIYDYLAKLAKKLHRTQKEIIYQARELGVSDEYERAKARYHKLHERLSRIGASNRSQYTFFHDSGAGSYANITDSQEAISDRIGTATVTVVSPVSASGTAITVIRGDDYLLTDGRQLAWNVS